MLLCAQAVLNFMSKEIGQMSNENMAVFPLLTLFLGFAIGLLLYPKIIGFHYEEPLHRDTSKK